MKLKMKRRFCLRSVTEITRDRMNLEIIMYGKFNTHYMILSYPRELVHKYELVTNTFSI